MATVYVTQLPHKWDPVQGVLVPSININPASAHGSLVILMPPQTSFIHTDLLLEQLEKALWPYDVTAGDCLLPLGDPVITACAVAVLTHRGRPFQILRWDKGLRLYTSVWIGTVGRRPPMRRSMPSHTR